MEKIGGLWQGRLLLLVFAHIVGTSGYFSVLALAPFIRTDLDIDATQFGFFASAYFGAQMVFSLPAGNFTDRIGIGRGLSLSMFLLALGISGFALSETQSLALLSMFLMGLGASLVNPATGKAVMDWFPSPRRGTIMGIKQNHVKIV